MQQRQEPTLDAAATADSTAQTPSQTPARKRRWLRYIAGGLATFIVGICLLLAGAWWWAGQSDSLSRTLARVASWMPADQQLEADGIEGSLRTGGRIGWLRWTSPALQVEIKGADIAWRLQPLLSRELRFGRIHMDELRIRSTPQPSNDSPTEPLQSLMLPMRLDVPVRIERLVWEGPPETVLTEVYGHYLYSGTEHQLSINSLRYAGSAYEADVRLQAQSPMQLQATLQGAIQAPLPNQPDQVLDIVAQAKVAGTLATHAAALKIDAQAHTVQAANASASDNALAADIQATIRPWATQPLESAQAHLRHLDAALFMPGGPRTDLSGQVQAGPEDNGWKLQADLTNTLPGPWDQQALPVQALTALVHFDGAQQWRIEDASLSLGKAGQGKVQVQGSYHTDSQVVEGQAQLQAVNPADLYSTLDAAPLSGALQASTDAQQQVQFTLDIAAAARADKNAALRIEKAALQGTWKAPQLALRNVHLDALQTVLRSDALTFDSSRQSMQGKLQATVPGAQLSLNADHASPTQGSGQVALQLTSAQALAQWLPRLPLPSDPLGGAQLQGTAQMELNWQGGWEKLVQRLGNPAAPLQASGMQLNGKLSVPDLQYVPAQGEAIHIKATQAQWQGSPENLQTQLTAQAQLGPQSLSIDSQLMAGLLVASGAAPWDWKLRIEQLQARWAPDHTATPTWQAQLTAPLEASQRTSGSPVRSTRIQASASSLQVTPPNAQESASVQWQPMLLQQSGSGAWAIQTKGQLQGVPLTWVELVAPDALNNAGISGDLVLQGNWDIDTTGRQLRAEALLERASGDIRLAVEDADAAPITMVRSTGASDNSNPTSNANQRVVRAGRGMRARLQALRLQLGAQGNEVRAQLLWNSERAGNVQADLRSQLQSEKSGWSWPTTAPLNGTVKADMPNIGIWAIFAPPGWRVGGTLDADIAISGTRSAPQWAGSLNANELSILSLLDGVDLKNGRLRTQLQGTQLNITELYLQGGEGSSTRILGQSGNLTSAPKDGGSLTGSGFVSYDPQAAAGSSGISMDIRAQAQQLQVLIRADRQLSVSGDLQAGMQGGQVKLRGDLKIDRAAIMLADESAPKLDDDVHVHSAASRKAAAERAQATAQPQGSVQASQPIDMLIKLDLGNDFALQGYGITTRLEGALNIANGPSITGEIHTVNGRYRAWGQSLDVDSGVIRFSGPYANPAIDIVAIRPNIAVRAGVKVTGSANTPRVTLFSEPDMSDAEKLSWVVMGRSAAAGGAETALLQQAALALLSGGGTGGNFAGQLGLDEVGLKGPSEDGEQGAAVTVGKRLSKDFYVAYEQSLSGAMGTLFIFYDISKRLTLRGQTGIQTAVDLIYTRTKD